MTFADAVGSRKPPRIAVVGSSIMDLVTYANNPPAAGETVKGEDFQMGFGGKGANQAVAARLCGAQVSMVARVGNDTFGKDMIKNFTDKGINATHVRTIDNVPTGVAPIEVNTRTGENRITIVTGANDYVTPQVVDEAASELEKAQTIIMQAEIPLETVYHTIDFAKKKGIRTIWNVAPAPSPDAPIDLKKLDGLDYLVLNEHEAEAVSGLPVKNAEDAKKSAAHLLSTTGVGKVIITLGKQGAILAGRDRTDDVAAFDMKDRTVDTAGAGDAFIGSFATFLGQGADELEAMQKASLYAGLSTTKKGTQKSYPTDTEFNRAWDSRPSARTRAAG